jgi:hypothetical protein
MIEDRNGTAKDRHERQDGDQFHHGVPGDFREHVHAAVVVEPIAKDNCNLSQYILN